MKNKPTLSIVPFYGGKSRMSHFITERLDYDNTKIFISPFGGMCSELLNKPRHPVEIYNDLSVCTTTLIKVLANKDTARELIYRLYHETTYSKEVFDKQKYIFDYNLLSRTQLEKNILKKLLVDFGISKPQSANRLIDCYVQKCNSNCQTSNLTAYLSERISLIDKKRKDDSDFSELFNNALSNYIICSQHDDIHEVNDTKDEIYSDIDIAMATYYVFQCSRDGLGQLFSTAKFKNNQSYLRNLLKLFDCADRLEGVQVYQNDAVAFYNNVPDFNHWINSPEVMMYCDPSYISVEDEKKFLEGIDVNEADSLSEAIMRTNKNCMPKNLGTVYAESYNYEYHEAFLKHIQKAKCKMMISNYDLILYNKYLTEQYGWKREEFHTTTSIGGKSNNKRIEVIWYNY